MDQLKSLKRKKWVKVSICFIIYLASGTIMINGYQNIILNIIMIVSFITGIVIALKKVRTEEEKQQRLNDRTLKEKDSINKKMNNLKKCEMKLAKHIKGLPVASGVLCNLYYKDECIEIDCSGNVFRLELKFITDINMKVKRDIVSGSAGGALLGYDLLGGAGALALGSDKEVKTKYLVITYNTNNQIYDI